MQPGKISSNELSGHALSENPPKRCSFILRSGLLRNAMNEIGIVFSSDATFSIAFTAFQTDISKDYFVVNLRGLISDIPGGSLKEPLALADYRLGSIRVSC